MNIESKPINDQFVRRMMTMCEVLSSVALSAFSFAVIASRRHLSFAFAENEAISPIARFIEDWWFLIHCPLVALVAGIVYDFVIARRSLNVRLVWMSCFVAMFAVLAAIWLMGITLPFWKLP